MKIRNFQASTVSEALRMVKKELGADAVILKTTPLNTKSRVGQPSKKTFQVTACVDDGLLVPQKTKKRSEVTQQPALAESSIRMINDILRDIQKDVKSLVEAGRICGASERISREMMPRYIHLVGQELDPALAESIVAGLEDSGLNPNDDAAIRKAILENIMKRLSGCIEIKTFVGKPNLVALIGPPGSGKSALVAKLASHFVTRKKMKVTLVSIDDFKPTAFDELSRLSKLLNVPCANGHLARDQRSESTIVLIDTAGISVGSNEELEALQEKLNNLGVDEIHLVLPAFCRWDDIRKWYRFFKPIGLTGVALTFLDQTPAYGAAVSLAILENVMFSYFSKGRASVADLESADIQKLAEKLVGLKEGAS